MLAGYEKKDYVYGRDGNVMLIPRFREPKGLRLDLKAGRQIFGEAPRTKNLSFTVPRDTENPIDIRLRQLAILGREINLVEEFVGKNAVASVGGLDIRLVKGKIRDLFPQTRDLRLRTRKGEDVIVSWGNVMELSEREL